METLYERRVIMGYPKGKVVAKGKTKVIYESAPGLVIVENKNDITKNDDPSQTMVIEKKAANSTATTCAVFSLLKKAGIPVAFKRQTSETEFQAPECKMIPLEVVVRRYAVGSYLNRHPELKKKGEVPHRFHRLVFEIFLKTTGGKIIMWNGKEWGETTHDSKTGRPIDDPFIANPYDDVWMLKHPKIPEWEKDSDNSLRQVLKKDFLPEGVTVEKIEEIARKVFLILEGAWAQLGCRIIDFKIEFGIDLADNLRVADVIDNDSWRLRTSDWQELSKQLFRDNAQMGDISDKYALVAKLVEQLRIPKQAIVLWRGSEKDKLPEFPEVTGVEKIDSVKSGHKTPQGCLIKLEELLAAYPEGGVIVALVGMSNGLGPILAARTSWPVIGVVMEAETHSEDAWSNLRLPSQVPMTTVLSPKNAVLAALNILAQKNPVAYMCRQYAIEELDK